MHLHHILRFICCARKFWQVLYIPALWNLGLCVRFTIFFLLYCEWTKLKFRPSPFPTRTVSLGGGGGRILYTVIAWLCCLFYKWSLSHRKMRLLIQKDRNISEKSLWNCRAVKAVKRYEWRWIWLWKTYPSLSQWFLYYYSAFRLNDHNTAVGYLQWNQVELGTTRSKLWCFIVIGVRVVGQKSLPARQAHFNTYKAVPRSRQ
jgi:hypothetical protein